MSKQGKGTVDHILPLGDWLLILFLASQCHEIVWNGCAENLELSLFIRPIHSFTSHFAPFAPVIGNAEKFLLLTHSLMGQESEDFRILWLKVYHDISFFRYSGQSESWYPICRIFLLIGYYGSLRIVMPLFSILWHSMKTDVSFLGCSG